MSTLRKALGEPDLITTVTGVGYRLTAPDARQ
jgi:DNA-binding winged helix-turn-helix (wHTH) protein